MSVERERDEADVLGLLPLVREVPALGTVRFDTDKDVLGVYRDGVVVLRRTHGNDLPAEAFFSTSRSSLDGAKSKGEVVSLAWLEIEKIYVSPSAVVGSRLLRGHERGRWVRIVRSDGALAEVFLSDLDAEMPVEALVALAPSVELDSVGPVETPTSRVRLTARPHSTVLRVLVPRHRGID